MEERQITIDGQTVFLEEPFMVIATQNPVESQQGTFPLPIAQMDRFFIKMSMGYPSFDEEKRIMQINRGEIDLRSNKQVFSTSEIDDLRFAVKNITISPVVEDYIIKMIRETRNHPFIELGVSPRGTLALMRAAQGKAFLEERDFVTPMDVKWVAPYLLSHRIILSTEGSLSSSPERIMEEIIHSIDVPVEIGENS
jgi:MoxR-like ATPase